MVLKLKSIACAAMLSLALPAMAHTQSFIAGLFGPAEATPNNSPAIGSAIVIIDDHDLTMTIQTTFQGLIGNVTAAHIHCCTTNVASGTAGVATMLPTFIGFPSGVKAGSYFHTFDMTQTASWGGGFLSGNGNSTLNAFSALLTGLQGGKAYLNIHTSSFPGGEIRGFLAAAPVPEPSTYALMALGLAGIGLLSRRRTR